jgi:hypothetical protein
MRLVLAAVLVAGCAEQNRVVDLAPKDPGKATVIVGVDQPDPGGSLDLSSYDPARHALTGRFVHLDLGSPSGRGFVWKEVDPGTYVLAGFYHKRTWGLCFTEDTRSFTIRAGERLYIGAFDPAPLTELLHEEAVAHDDLQLPAGQIRSYYMMLPTSWTDAIVDPQPPDQAVRLSYFVTGLGVRPAAVMPARFEKSFTVTGAPICGI